MSGAAARESGGARLALAVLTAVYALNYLDRQILSILAEDVKRDLGLGDAQIGFLYGTAFAVFYAVFGLPLGRLADTWTRTRVISMGLGVWSLMTTVSGLARTFTQLAFARFGVGIGEASANPAAFSLIADYFRPERRATAMAIYQTGIYIGSGLGLGIGGLVVSRWDHAFAAAPAPFGLRGWQVAFFVVGIPGLVLAPLVARLAEPERGRLDGVPAPNAAHPFRDAWHEVWAVLPPLTLVHLRRLGATPRAIVANVVIAGAIAAVAWGLTVWLGNAVQWIAMGLGLYAGVSWAHALRLRDRASFALMFEARTPRLAALGFACIAAVGYGVNFWTAPFFIRVHGMERADAGLVLGATHAIAGWIGVTAGGLLADRWRRRAPAGRLYTTMLAASLPIPFAFAMLRVPSQGPALACYAIWSALAGCWGGAAVAVIQDLVLPRMRGTAAAIYLLLATFVGLAIGPYAIGRVSQATGDLGTAMQLGLVWDGVALVCLAGAARYLAGDEAGMHARARAAGDVLA
jgi:MFS family permease